METTMKFLKNQMKQSTGNHCDEKISMVRFIVTYYAAWLAGLLVLSVASVVRRHN